MIIEYYSVSSDLEPGCIRKKCDRGRTHFNATPVMWTFGTMFSGNLLASLQTKQIILLGATFFRLLLFHYLHCQQIHQHSLFMLQSDYSA